MRHPINPLVDCVFKALFGDPRHASILVHFLNSVLRPATPIREVQILNPYNEKEYDSDKLTIIDIKAKDNQGAHYQIEVQLLVHRALPARMLYTWSGVYNRQMTEGNFYDRLRPVYAIWLLNGQMFEDSPAYHHCFEAYDPTHRVRLSDHLALHILELPKWQLPADVLEDEDRWLYFLQDAGHWKRLPPALKIPEMEKAMSILQHFSEDDAEYFRYQSRLDAMRVQKMIEMERDEAVAERDQAVQALTEAQNLLAQEKDQLAHEKDQLAHEKDQLTHEKDQLAHEKDLLAQEKDQLAARLAAAELAAAQALAAQEAERARLLQKLRALGIDPADQ